jgi:hypothetical protein
VELDEGDGVLAPIFYVYPVQPKVREHSLELFSEDLWIVAPGEAEYE